MYLLLSGQNGNEVVVLEFGRDENGNPKKDFDGIGDFYFVTFGSSTLF